MVPLQDLLGLGVDTVMNRPGTAEGNWIWRFRENDLTPELAAELKGWTALYGREPYS